MSVEPPIIPVQKSVPGDMEKISVGSYFNDQWSGKAVKSLIAHSSRTQSAM